MRLLPEHLLVATLSVVGCGGGARAPSSASPSALSSAPRLSAGASHTCAVVGGGGIACWGSNVDGQLGDGTTTDRSLPVTVLGVNHAVGVSAGSYHACALLADTSVTCWGWDSYGQVGSAATVARPNAAAVPGLSGVVAIATGGYHTCAVERAGDGSCWGQNDVGQLGDGATVDSDSPAAIFSLPASSAIAAGGRHSCVVVHDGFHDGTVQCWGANDTGELGDGTQGDRAFPTLVSGLRDALAVATGFTHSCALLSDGSVWCWGANDHGQLGDGAASGAHSAVPVPVQLPGLTATAIAAGYNHSCAILIDASVACWGANGAAQLGVGTSTDRSTPTLVPGLSDVAHLAGGAFHTCAETTQGSVLCWGLNEAGQLGDGTTLPHSTPSAIFGMP